MNIFRSIYRRLLHWLGPIAGWLNNHLQPIVTLAAPFIERVQCEHPDWTGEQKREWVAKELALLLLARRLPGDREDILTGIRIAYKLWKRVH